MKLISVVMALLMLSPDLQVQSRRNRPAKPVTQTAARDVQPGAQSLPIRRVVLYSNGVAYFERRGTVTGRAEISLSFKQSQVDDVLKSMIVLDLGRGRIGAVSYNSSAPPSSRLADIPFSVESGTDDETIGGLAAVLRQLQGARVVITSAGRTGAGAILTVEERKAQIDANKPPVTTRSLVIATEAGELMSFDLPEIRSVKLLDEGSRHDVAEFAVASASARRRDAKTIVITSDGEGSREMVVSYTVAAPIWKTTYRVVLDSSGKPFFQGWAIVDNVGEEDWTDVALSMVSGTPVSFIQPIQQPLFRYRPVVPIPDDLNVDPQTYEPGAVGGMGLASSGGVPGGVPGGIPGGVVGGLESAERARQQRNPQAPNQLGRSNAGIVPPPPPDFSTPTTTLSDVITGEDSGVTTAATGAEVGDLFEYRIDQRVTVRHDRSALIPILQTRMEGERVSIYSESARKDRPMGGMRLRNISALTLEGGSLTVIDGDAYAGEALLERFKPGEERFISFSLDLGTLVSARVQNAREPTFLVRVSNGVFQAHYYQTETKAYSIVNQTERPRVVYVEHPVRSGWVLAGDTPKPASRSASVYRFRVELAAHSTIELPVTERRVLMDTYSLSNLTPRDIELFVSRRYIDEATRAALEKITEIKTKIDALNARIEEGAREVEDIGKDQRRLRENIEALKETSEARLLIARYVAKAGEQETRIEKLASERRTASAERGRLQEELGAAIRILAWTENCNSGIKRRATNESPHLVRRSSLPGLDRYRCPVELCQREAVEVLVEAGFLFAKGPDRELLAKPQRLVPVRPPVNAGDVAADCDVVRELVQLPADGQRRTAEIQQRQPIVAWDNRVGDYERLVEVGLQDSRARAGDCPVTRAISRVRRTAFRKSHRQEVRAVSAEHRSDRCRVQDIRVDRIVRRTGDVVVHASAELLRPQPSMHKPLLIPDRLQRASRNAAHRRRNVGIAQRTKPDLIARRFVWVPVVERRPDAEQNQQRIEISLEQHVNVHPLADVAPVPDIAAGSVKHRRPGGSPVLNGQPLCVTRHIVHAGNRGAHPAVYGFGAERCVLPHELRDIRPDAGSRTDSAKQRRGRHLPSGLRTAKVREAR